MKKEKMIIKITLQEVKIIIHFFIALILGAYLIFYFNNDFLKVASIVYTATIYFIYSYKFSLKEINEREFDLATLLGMFVYFWEIIFIITS